MQMRHGHVFLMNFIFFGGGGQFILIQFKSECGTALLRLSLLFLFYCYNIYCHGHGCARQDFAFVELINLDLIDDDIFD